MRILVTGSNGQLGTVLTQMLQKKYGIENVIASDLKKNASFKGVFEILDVTDFEKLQEIVIQYKISHIYHLAAILSALGESNPLKTWDINMQTWLHVLEVARLQNVERIFYPSSIAVFGATALKNNTPNTAFLDPSTVYGISKASGENWANYYHIKYGLDIRSIRYPGVVGYQSLPGGGTTDYAVDIFHKLIQNEVFYCFLDADTQLPMIFIDDAIRATIELMEAPIKSIKNRSSYNISGTSFSPNEIVQEILKKYPNFKVVYQPDFRQDIAIQWPRSIDDKEAKKDWNWNPHYNLEAITNIMIEKIEILYNN